MNRISSIMYECDKAAYRVLSDATVSKTTSKMSEEGREAVAKEIAKSLHQLLMGNDVKSTTELFELMV